VTGRAATGPEPDSNGLRQVLNDLVALLALSSAWGTASPNIGLSLAEALVAMLELDFAFTCPKAAGDSSGGASIELGPHLAGTVADEVLTFLSRHEGQNNSSWPREVTLERSGIRLLLAHSPLGMRGEYGSLVVGASRPGFPQENERLLLNVASNLALAALQQAQLDRNRRENAIELDRRVAERTAELAAANVSLEAEVSERKRIEAALRISELNANSLVEGIPGFVAVLGPGGRVERVNQRIIDYCGADIDVLQDWGTNGIVHPDDMPHVAEQFGSSMATGAPYDIEQRLRRHDGEYRWFGNRGLPLRDERGEILAWHVLLTDIHDRKLAEAALAGRERNLRLIIDTIPAMAWSARADGTADFFNKQYLEFVGRSHDDLADWQWTSLVHPDDLDTIGTTWAACRDTGSGAEVEARLLRHDGVYRWFRFQTSPLRDEQGKVVQWYGINTDIEDRKRAEEELAERERNLREAHEHLTQAQRLTHTGSFRTDVLTDAHIQSEELYRILGCAPAKLRDFRDHIHPADRDMFDSGFARAMADRSSFDETFRFIRPDGEIVYLHAVAHFLNEPDDRPVVMGSIQDISESKRVGDALDELRSELAHVTRAMSLGELTASIAHEVNQPLTGIITNASICIRLLSAEPPDIAGAINTAQRSLRDGNRASEVIKRLRGLFSRQEFTLETIDLNEAAREVVALCTTELQRRQISLSTEFDPDLPPVLGDRVQLQQVILNLCLNAADAIGDPDDRPRRIVIRTFARDGGALLSVADSGRGISTPDAGRIFEAFYSTKADGMGMGLSVSKSIVERHNGKLWFEPDPELGGARFSIILPFQSDSRSPLTEEVTVRA
jgi:PAS domain S-box-containing protein